MSVFPPNSRYAGIEPTKLKRPDGTVIAYLPRRFVPPAENFVLLQEHVVTQGERLDNITARYIGDPLLFWQVCDANNAMRPEELTETPGRRLRITLPQGIPGPSNG
jgi:hypothetical protein